MDNSLLSSIRGFNKKNLNGEIYTNIDTNDNNNNNESSSIISQSSKPLPTQSSIQTSKSIKPKSIKPTKSVKLIDQTKPINNEPVSMPIVVHVPLKIEDRSNKPLQVPDYNNLSSDDDTIKKVKSKKIKDKKPKSIKTTKKTEESFTIDNTISIFLPDKIPSPLLASVFVLGFLASLDTTIIFPTLSSYVSTLNGSPFYYGLIAGSYSIGQIIGSPLLGWWIDNRNIKESMLLCSILSFIGNLVYFFGGSTHLINLFIGRIVSGCGGACLLVSYAHIARVSSIKSERNISLATYAWIVRLGQVIAPIIGALGTINESSNGEISLYTIPPLIMIVLFGSFILVLIGYIIYSRDEMGSSMYHLYADPMEDSGLLSDNYSFFRKESLILLAIYFAHIISYWSYVTVAIPYIHNRFGYSVNAAYLYFLFIGVIFAASYGIFRFFQQYASDQKAIISSLLFSALGLVCSFKLFGDVGLIQLLISSSLLVGGYCIGSVLTPVVYTSLLGVKLENLGSFHSTWFAVVSIAMAVGPIWGASSTYFYNDFTIVSVVGLGLIIFALVILLLFPIINSTHNSFSPTASRINNIEIQLEEGTYNDLKDSLI